MLNNILLVGFEPFLNYDYNPSGEIAKRLDGKRVLGSKIIGKVLPVKHIGVREIIGRYIRQYKPNIVILLGVKEGAGCIVLERIAINRYYFRNKQEEADEPLSKNAPAAYFSKLPLAKIKRKLESHGIPTEYSFFPDTYLCNEVFYEIMRISEKSGISKAGILHLPLAPRQVVEMRKTRYSSREKIPSMDENTMEEAVKMVIQTTLNA